MGQTSFPSDFGTGGLGAGAALTMDGYFGAQCPAGPGHRSCLRTAPRDLEYIMLAHAESGAAGQAALASQVSRYRSIAVRPTVPTSLVNFGVSVNFPLVVSLVLALFGIATLVHLLLVGVARRRHRGQQDC